MSHIDLSVLPRNAQQELIDFYEFLIEKYKKKQHKPHVTQKFIPKFDEEKILTPESLLPITNGAEKQNCFENLFGILTAKHSISLEEMEEAISQQALECFNDCD